MTRKTINKYILELADLVSDKELSQPLKESLVSGQGFVTVGSNLRLSLKIWNYLFYDTRIQN